MAQTTYTQNFAVAFAGMLSQAGTRFEKIVSKCVGTTAASIAGGLFCCRDTTDDTVKPPTATGMVTATGVGFVIHDVAKEPKAADGGVLENVTGQMVGVMEFGTMYVTSEQAVNYGDPVFVRFAAGTGTILGACRKDADTATAVALPGCRFNATIAAPGLVEIERLPSN
jgi:hypothetical protein